MRLCSLGACQPHRDLWCCALCPVQACFYRCRYQTPAHVCIWQEEYSADEAGVVTESSVAEPVG